MGLLTNYKLSDFTGVRLNKFIKLQLFKYFRFDRDYIFVCSEGINNADMKCRKNDIFVDKCYKQYKYLIK